MGFEVARGDEKFVGFPSDISVEKQVFGCVLQGCVFFFLSSPLLLI